MKIIQKERREEFKTKKYQGSNNFVSEEERFESLQQPFFQSLLSTDTGVATLVCDRPHQNILLACIPNRLGSKTATKTVIFPLRTVRTKNHEKYGREFFFKKFVKYELHASN